MTILNPTSYESKDRPVPVSAAPPPVPSPALAKIDTQIEGLRMAGRLMGEAQRCARFHYWSGRSSSVALHAIAGARSRLSREIKKLKTERAGLEEKLWLP